MVTFLPPIEFICGIFFKKFYRSEKIAAQGILKYIHITLDSGGVIKAFHVIFNCPNCFTHITIHLDDFHLIQAHFGVIGSYAVWSRFKNIIYQLELCQPGTMKALPKWKHYIQPRMIYESFAETISKTFTEKYVPYNIRKNQCTEYWWLYSPW